MKKLFAMTAIALAATTASALEVGVRGVHTQESSPDMVGLTVTKRVGVLNVEAAVDRSTRGAQNVNRWSLTGSHDVAKVAGVTLAAKAGVAYIDPSVSQNGVAALVGVGATYPLTKKVSLVADYAYQRAQYKVSDFSGNTVSTGIKVAF